MVMPNDVEIYVPLTGSKIHIRPHCGGLNTAKKETIDEVDFLEMLESGKGCSRCCGSDMMVERIKRILKRGEDKMNFLEQLAGEWYEFNGYFVRTNVRLGNREKGGFTGEIDVVAYDPKDKTIIHVETSGAAGTKSAIATRMQRQFRVASEQYDSMFDFKPKEIKKIAIVGTARTATIDIGEDIKVYSVPQFIMMVSESMKEHPLQGEAIPEGYPLLRAMQFAYWWGTSRDKG